MRSLSWRARDAPGSRGQRSHLQVVLSTSSAQLLGAAFLLGYIYFLTPGAPGTARQHLALALWTVVLGATTAALLCVWVARPLRSAELARRSDAVAVMLAAPRHVAAATMAAWVGAGVVVAVAEADEARVFPLVRDVAGVLIAGVWAASLAYLLAERRLRPHLAQAAGGRAPTASGGMSVLVRVMALWAVGSAVPLVTITAAMISTGADDPPASATAVVFLALAGLLGGGLLVGVAVRSLAHPLSRVRDALARVRQGDLSVEVPVDDGGELGLLQAGVNEMVSALRERQHLADLLGRYIGHSVAESAIKRGLELGGEEIYASILFVDLVDSTRLVNSRRPADVVSVLNTFFDIVVRSTASEDGWINKFQGDAALCVFGVPVAQQQHAGRALRCARRLARDLRRGLAEFGLDAGVGVSSGLVVAGTIGAADRFEYTVIGSPVNEAARLAEAAKSTPARVLTTAITVRQAGAEARYWGSAGSMPLRGFPYPTEVHTLTGLPGADDG